MSGRSNDECNDDYYLDGSKYGADDLDYAHVPFFGGSLDGKVMIGGIDTLPEEVSARSLSPKGDSMRERYLLATSLGDPKYHIHRA
jgi:hypothetical protein